MEDPLQSNNLELLDLGVQLHCLLLLEIHI